MRTLLRGLVLGTAFGLASTCFQTWMGVSQMMSLRLPPAPLPLARAMLLEVTLAASIGVLLAPLLRFPRGGVWHGLGVALHERPIISRLVSLDHPMEIKEGMVFALETYCPAKDGSGAARIEEEVVVTADGCKVITLFPAEELPIANPY